MFCVMTQCRLKMEKKLEIDEIMERGIRIGRIGERSSVRESVCREQHIEVTFCLELLFYNLLF